MNCAKTLLQRIDLTIFEAYLLVEVNAVGQEQMQHLGKIIVQLALTLYRLLHLNHGLPNVAEVVLVTFHSCVLVRSSLQLLKLSEVLVPLLSLAHRDLATERF